MRIKIDGNHFRMVFVYVGFCNNTLFYFSLKNKKVLFTGQYTIKNQIRKYYNKTIY